MRYFTKEWYDLMQHLDYTLLMKQIPDEAYTDAEIRAAYRARRDAEIAAAREKYDIPPDMSDLSEQLRPENFNPKNWPRHSEDGTVYYLSSPEEVFEWYRQDGIDFEKMIEWSKGLVKRMAEQFENRPPFDPGAVEKRFRARYMAKIRNCDRRFPAWVCQQVDRRLLAMDFLPQSVFKKLKDEEKRNKEAFEEINRAKWEERSRQQIPERISKAFDFHDAYMLSLRKRGRNYEMIMQNYGVIKVVFTDAALLEREKGLIPRLQVEENGMVRSNCIYLYDEMYSVEGGYEIHMLFDTNWKDHTLAYLTVRCADVLFERDAALPKSRERDSK